jgi:hypothetical protein
MTEPQLMIFEISGLSEFIQEPNQGDRLPKTPTIESDSYNAKENVKRMNEQADSISEKIERDLKKLLPPMVTVQANVQFELGSLILTGTVAVLAWGGSILSETIKKEMEEQLASIVKMSVQRVINRTMIAQQMYGSVEPMQMTVKPQFRAMPGISPIVTEQIQPNQVSQPLNNSSIGFRYLVFATVLIFIIQLLMLLDRLFVLQWRP